MKAEAAADGWLREAAPAKVNLTLHVTGQRRDGLHLIDSLVAFATTGDRLAARPSGAPALDIGGPMAAGVPADGRNLILRAAALFGAPAAFRLEKHLPAAAGLGGGSADAAAALRLLSRLTGRAIPAGIEALGADLPACLESRRLRMRGIGEILGPAGGVALPALLVNPGVALPTARVFAGLAAKANPPMPERLPALADAADAAAWLKAQRNDLEAPAIALAPVVGEVLARLAALDGALLARMSGSGATCFALFGSAAEARAAERDIRAAQPGWWTAATLLV